MGSAIGQTMGLAVGVAISPVPIIAVILMLFTPKAKSNSVTFLLGWLFGLVAVGTIVLLADVASSDGSESDSSGGLKVVLGIVFLVLAAKNWRNRPEAGTEPEMPKWMASIDGFTPVKSFGLGAVLSGVNPKNLALTVAAAASISATSLSNGDQFAVLGVFVVLASLTVALPVVFYLAMGHKADATLTTWKEWLSANNATVMMVLFVVFGIKLLGDGLGIVS
jgi:hypothetical protein